MIFKGPGNSAQAFALPPFDPNHEGERASRRMDNGGALLDKLFVIVETVALRWARPVVELELLAKRRDLSCASVSKQHPAVQHRVCGQERKSKQKRRIICVDFGEPVTVNAILSRAQSCREGHFRAMRGNIESFLDSVRMRNCLTRLYLDVSCCLVQSQCILLFVPHFTEPI